MRSLFRTVTALCLTLAVSTIAHAQTPKNLDDEIGQSDKAARVFREIMDTPDKGIPKDLLEKAECVGVFPSVIKAGFILGGRGGRGVASCRTVGGWSSPIYLNLGGGSIGLQIGGQSTDFVMLFMNKDGIEQSAVERVHAGRRRVGGRRTSRPTGRSVNRPEAQRADPLLLAQQRVSLPASSSKAWSSSRTRMTCATCTARASRPERS